MMRQIFADYDEQGIYVYQAFRTETVQAAVAKGTFGQGFSLDRMTWIKPSFGWMLYRSGYETKHRQEAIAKIRLTHEGLRAILRQSVETSQNPQVYASADEWKQALDNSEVRHQWDPDRALNGYKLDRRAIQIGISGATVRSYVNEWIIGIEDATDLAHAVHEVVIQRRPLPVVQEERLYTVDAELARRLGISNE